MRFAERALAFVGACLAACGNASTPPRHVERANVVDASAIVEAAVAIDAGPDKMELLAARRERIAAGMREIARRDVDIGSAKDATLALEAFTVDSCVRAAFDSDAPTEITLTGSNAMTLATVDASNGAIGAAGPVCFRKGDTATFHFNGQSRLRIIVWSSP